MHPTPTAPFFEFRANRPGPHDTTTTEPHLDQPSCADLQDSTTHDPTNYGVVASPTRGYQSAGGHAISPVHPPVGYPKRFREVQRPQPFDYPLPSTRNTSRGIERSLIPRESLEDVTILGLRTPFNAARTINSHTIAPDPVWPNKTEHYTINSPSSRIHDDSRGVNNAVSLNEKGVPVFERTGTFRFMDLPPEMRKCIFPLVAGNEAHRADTGRREQARTPSLPLTSVQICNESLGIFYLDRTFECTEKFSKDWDPYAFIEMFELKPHLPRVRVGIVVDKKLDVGVALLILRRIKEGSVCETVFIFQHMANKDAENDFRFWRHRPAEDRRAFDEICRVFREADDYQQWPVCPPVVQQSIVTGGADEKPSKEEGKFGTAGGAEERSAADGKSESEIKAMESEKEGGPTLSDDDEEGGGWEDDEPYDEEALEEDMEEETENNTTEHGRANFRLSQDGYLEAQETSARNEEQVGASAEGVDQQQSNATDYTALEDSQNLEQQVASGSGLPTSTYDSWTISVNTDIHGSTRIAKWPYHIEVTGPIHYKVEQPRAVLYPTTIPASADAHSGTPTRFSKPDVRYSELKDFDVELRIQFFSFLVSSQPEVSKLTRTDSAHVTAGLLASRQLRDEGRIEFYKHRTFEQSWEFHKRWDPNVALEETKAMAPLKHTGLGAVWILTLTDW